MKLVLSSLQLFFDMCGISGLKIKGRPNETKFARGLSLRPTFIILNPYESPWTLDVHWFDHFSLWPLGPQKGLQGLNLVWDIYEQRSTGLIFSKTIWVEALGSLICTLLVINFNQRAPGGLTNFVCKYCITALWWAVCVCLECKCNNSICGDRCLRERERVPISNNAYKKLKH